jgi:hypothetical protein
MGHACPVCETPQRDAEHLANHLAFTAMLHGDAHEAWLDDHAPGWGEEGAAELAPIVADHAPEAEYEAVFEDTVPEGEHTHEHPPATDPGTGDLDDDARRALAEAREMTRAMLEAEEDNKA